MPIVGKPMAKLWREDLLPFRQLLPQLTLVKMSYATYKAYDFDLAVQAMYSPNVLEGLLRVKLGYRGLTVVDLYEAITEISKALPSSGSDEERAVSLNVEAFAKSIMAGCEMQVVRWGGTSHDLIDVALKKALDAGTLLKRRADEALKRIRRAKKGIRRPSGKFSKRDFDRLCRQFEDFRRECGAKE